MKNSNYLEHYSFIEEFKDVYNYYMSTDYGKQLLSYDGVSPDKLDIPLMSERYFNNRLADMSIDQNANANESISPINYQSEVVKGVLKLDGEHLLFKKMLSMYGLKTAKRLMMRIWDKDVYFHDASAHGIQTIYCVAFSTAHLMSFGRPYGQLHSLAPHRADSFIAQAIETIMDMSNTVMGAVAPADLIVNYAYFAKKDRNELSGILYQAFLDGELTKTFRKLLALDYRVSEKTVGIAIDLIMDKYGAFRAAEIIMEEKILNDLQKMVHIVNNKYRVSGQSPFVNVSLYCRNTLRNLFEHVFMPDGSPVDYDYVMYVQKLYGEFIAKGDPNTGLPYRFPVSTVNLNRPDVTKGDAYKIDSDFKKWVAKVNCKTGVFNIYVSTGNKIAMCCRYQNDMTQMRQFRTDTFGNGGLNIGSSRVITINLPRVALRAKGDWHVFTLELLEVLDDIKLMHMAHREILKERIAQGFVQFFEPLKWLTLNQMFATVGIHGVHEMNVFMGYDIKSPDGKSFTTQVLKLIDDTTLDFSKECDFVFNTEEIPGESTAPLLAACDRLLFGEKEQPFELYSNQYIPLISGADIFEKMELSGVFMELLSGGGIAHFNVEEKMISAEMMEYLIDLAIEMGVPHFAINYGFGICEHGHVSIVGNGTICPICGGKISDWMTRIIGYFVFVSTWNKTRKDYEFPRRKFTNNIEIIEGRINYEERTSED